MNYAVNLKEDRTFAQISTYCWLNIEVGERRVGKARVRLVSKGKLIVNSITIFPEFQRRGYARSVIQHCKENYEQIIADRVRGTAIGFWEKMGFSSDGRGNYVWNKRPGAGPRGRSRGHWEKSTGPGAGEKRQYCCG